MKHKSAPASEGYIRNIRVFISSPGDMSAERELAARICKNIEQDIGHLLRFRIDPIRWETHATSAIADRSQEAITEQVGRYDIYLGIMGYYFGSSTLKYNSGTEEEFADALRGHREEASPKKVQFYFSAAAVHPDNIVSEQFARVKKFKKDVGSAGVFYRDFEDLPKLEVLLRQALLRDVHQIAGDDGESAAPATVPQFSELKPYLHLRNLDELLSNDHSAAIQLLTRNAVNFMDSFVSDLNGSTAKLTKFSKHMAEAGREAGAVAKNPKKIKYLVKKIEQVFDSMELFIDDIFEKIQPLEDNFTKSLSSFQRAASIQSIVSDDYDTEIGPAVNALGELRQAVLSGSATSRNLASTFPVIEGLGTRWDANRKILAAVLIDFAEFQERMISSIDALTEILYSKP